MFARLHPFFLVLIFLTPCIEHGHAHGLWQPDPGLALHTEIVVSYRNRGSSDTTLWQVPGTLMGGEAEGNEQGFSVPGASLRLSYFDAEQGYGIFELSQHAGHREPELEQVFAGWLGQFEGWQFQAEAGKFTARFSPQNGRHAVQDHFVDAPLSYSVLYGGQFNDVGARFIASHPLGRGVGVEIFEGGRFPASDSVASSNSSPRAADLFAYYHFVFDHWLLQARVWHNWFKAHRRPDDRLTSDSVHSHSPLDVSNISPYWFDGETRIHGLRAKLIWLGWSWAQVRLTSELFKADISGTISDDSKIAELESTLHAGWVKLVIQKESHTLALAYEQIKTDNIFIGDAGPALANLAGLMDIGRNPSRARIAYLQQSTASLGWSIEVHRDRSAAKSDAGVIASLRWQTKWL